MQKVIEIDIHSLTTKKAKQIIDLRLKSVKNIDIIRIIHGYNNGTALRDMVRKTYKNNEKIERIEFGMNGGSTDLIIRK